MSIASEITRLQGVKSDILQAIADKGVTVPVGSALDDCPSLIASITGGGDGSVVIGGRTYRTVKIGTQEWLAENLDYKFTGCEIGGDYNVTTPMAWYYNNNETDYGIDGTYKCGLLYNWYAAKYLDDNKATLLPEGWHVPSTTEYDTLASIVGGESTGGTKLKALDNSVTSNWPSSWNGTDDYGFNALPTGFRNINSGGTFVDVGSHAHYWLIEEYSSSNAYSWYAGTYAYIASSIYNPKTNGFSIRLVKDAT